MHSLPFLSKVLLLEQYIWDCRIDSLCSIQIEEVNTDISAEVHCPADGDETHSKEIREVNGEVAVSGDDGHWSEKSNPLASSSHFLIWKPFSEIIRSYEGDLWGESSQKFDFLQSYTPLHLPQRQRLVNGYEKWVHFPRGKDLGIISVSEDEISSIISYALCLAHDLLYCMEILETSPILVMDGSMAVAHKESFLQDGMRRILCSKPCLTCFF